MQNQTRKTALLIMDIQNGIVSRLGEDTTAMLVSVQKAIEVARQNHFLIIFVKVGFSEGYPEISLQNKPFSAIPNRGGMTISDESTQIHETISPIENEPVVTKYRVSAFTGSNLEIILHSQQIDTLILSGISTSGVVLSTLREAADKDFILTVLSDACFDPDPEIHRILIEKVFPVQADVLTVNDWINSLHRTCNRKK